MLEDWLSKVREEGKDAYARANWPSQADSPTQKNYTRFEDFDLTKFQGESKTNVSFKTKGGIKALALGELKNEDLAIFTEKFSTTIPPSEHKMLALKDAWLENGFLIHAPAESEGEVEITCDANGVVGLHGIVVLEKNSNAKIYQKQNASGAMVAEATEVFCGEGSKLNFDYTQKMGFDSPFFTVKRAVLQENAKLIWNTAFFGGNSTIATIDSKLDGEGSRAENYNAYFGSEKQVFDISTNSYHYTQKTGGNVLSKGVLTGEAQSTYRGLIHIAKTGQGTNCFLNGHALLLSEKAKANSVPSLEIFTNDVQSRHGATVDQIDSEKVFYLNSRGLSKREAVKTIVEGFIGEVFQKSNGNALKDWEEIFTERMESA